MFIGHGYDAHRLVVGRPLILCGVRIKYHLGLEAHSDGDVAIHALCDALLGAAGLGDIGKHFPDTSPQYRDIDSRILLRAVVSTLLKQGLNVNNADLTIVAQAPKLAQYIPSMRENLAGDLKIPAQRTNVKATTTEGMGFTGTGEGIACHAVVLLSYEINKEIVFDSPV
ncbi:2-C-methyl-D-erythritol 2,4-cyclodiphosphate synthase [Achromatium sp. WMS2]|nr:2-C-methyl-D-erythritol 2,4-cyclodiphosphate synthase [Achromatium sp. WMS2]